MKPVDQFAAKVFEPVPPSATDSRPSPTSVQVAPGLRVTNGQIIVSEKGGPDSLLVSLLLEEFHPFVHAGVIVIDDQRAYVYEQAAMLMPSFGPPTGAMRGKLRRIPVERFLAGHRMTAIFEPGPEVDRNRVTDFARQHLEAGTRFDPYFDDSDDTSMYCTEFVALALEAGGSSPIDTVSVRNNPSVEVALDWLRVRTDSMITAGTLTQGGARRIALMSPTLTQREIEMYFELKAELHRRFTADQKLGNALRWSWMGLRFSEGVAEYFRAGLQAARDAEDNRESARIAASLARDTFGAFEPEVREARR